MTALAAAHGSTQLGDPAALTNGFSAAFLGAAAIAAVGGLLALLALHQPPAAAGEPTTATLNRAPTTQPVTNR